MAKRNVYLYLIRLSNGVESFSKIGISVNKYSRFYQIMKHGYACTIEYMITGCDYIKLLNIERSLHEFYSSKKHTPSVKFGGYTECYKGIDKIEYIKKLRELYAIDCEVIKDLPVSWR